MSLSFEIVSAALAETPLFENKTWRLSPEAWPLTPEQVAELEAIGEACVALQNALENLYLRSASGKKLLRNQPLVAPWVAEYLDRGKPDSLVAHGRDARLRGVLPPVLRPDLLLTDDGWVLTELDSVPGGIGLTGFLNRLYAADPSGPTVLGGADDMIEQFYATLAAHRPAERNPVIALVVSEEAATYRPEMEWLAAELQRRGRRVFCLKPEDLFPLGGALHFDGEGNPERIDVLYRFFELFDLDNLPATSFILDAWEAGEVAVTPPLRAFQEEKLGFALFHHHLLRDYWAENLDAPTRRRLERLIPPTWVIDPAPLPPGAILDAPPARGRALNDWRDLAQASQKERELIIKISGYHETAWGARSVVLGSDVSREEWQEAINRAIELAPRNLHLLQAYRKPRRLEHPLFAPDGGSAAVQPGRLRLCPYYFIRDGAPRLAGALATFCPPDKKIIHGMQDAALLPCRIGP